MTITPDQADQWAQRATDGPWSIDPDYGTVEPDVISGEGCRFEASDEDLALIAAAPDLAQTIAGMTEEWAKEFRVNGGIWIPEMWHRNRADAERDQYMRWRDHTTTIESRLVRRLVSETEVVEP